MSLDIAEHAQLVSENTSHAVNVRIILAVSLLSDFTSPSEQTGKSMQTGRKYTQKRTNVYCGCSSRPLLLFLCVLCVFLCVGFSMHIQDSLFDLAFVAWLNYLSGSMPIRLAVTVMMDYKGIKKAMICSQNDTDTDVYSCITGSHPAPWTRH